MAKLIYAHLLRKNDQIDEARPFYDAALEADPDSLPADSFNLLISQDF